ncbi:MAG TPA: hypothetical protein VF594_10005, partial [Rubricoccaceae bacterium]
MALRAHRLSADADAAFLSEHRVDPVAGRAFEPGDVAVVCAACGTAMLAETWAVLGGAHCGQTETADRLTGGVAAPARSLSPTTHTARRPRPVLLAAVGIVTLASVAALSVWLGREAGPP